MRQKDLVEYHCISCKNIFRTQFYRIKPEGNYCSPCRTRLNNGRRIYLSPSSETRRKMAIAKIGRPGPWKGKKFSPEHIEKVASQKRGKPSPFKGVRKIPIKERILRKKIHDCCSQMIRRVLRIKNEVKARKTFEYLGYTKTDLIKHMEAKFIEGMSWDNYGDWHVDHIIPVSYFVKNKIFDTNIINSLDNLQPLWKLDNLKKAHKLPSELFQIQIPLN